MMGQQTSKLLQSVFRRYSRYSAWDEESTEWKMQPENLEDFLAEHQEDSRQYSQEDILDIMLTHKKEVTSSKV